MGFRESKASAKWSFVECEILPAVDSDEYSRTMPVTRQILRHGAPTRRGTRLSNQAAILHTQRIKLDIVTFVDNWSNTFHRVQGV